MSADLEREAREAAEGLVPNKGYGYKAVRDAVREDGFVMGYKVAATLREKEIATLRARVAELTAVLRTYLTDCGCGIPKPSDCGEIIKWINSDRQNINDCCMGCRDAAHLMAPPIPVPETKP